MVELSVLMVFMVLCAFTAVGIRSLLSAEVALGMLGVALCFTFAMLRAPEVAITQLIVELLVLVILLRASGVKRDMIESRGGLREIVAAVAVTVFVVIFGLASIWALHHIPSFGSPLLTVSKTYIKYSMERSDVPNMVSSILFNFRSADTLAALAVLFSAVVGVLAVMRPKGKKGPDERDDV